MTDVDDIPDEIGENATHYAFAAFDDAANILSGSVVLGDRDDHRVYAERVALIEQLIDDLERRSDHTTGEILRDVIAQHNDPGSIQEGSE